MSSFHERQKSLFEHLKDAEDQCSFSKSNKSPVAPNYGIIDKYTHRKLKHEMKQFRGRESIYKRQDANIKECLRAKTIPDYIKNPKNWVYYSLSDVTPEQMSDSTNTATALAFLRELEDRDATKSMECDMDESGLFKKPIFLASKTFKKEPKEQEKAVFKSNKLIMPEYVVGQSKKIEKKKILPRRVSQEGSDTAKKLELKLDHLYGDDDEEN